MSDVFISYSRKDVDFVRRLHAALSQQQRDTWVDWEDIPLTADWWREVQAGIEAADAFVFVISPDSVRSDICRQEIEHAVANNKRIIPILHREITEAADRKLMHPIISSHNWIFFRESDDFEAAFGSLVNAFNTDLGYVRQHTRLLVRAREWNNNGQNPSLLLRGDDLRDAEKWLAQAVSKEPAPLPLHAEFLAVSRTAETRRQRSLLAGVSVALVVSIALAVISLALFGEANFQRNLADQSAATAVDAQAEAEDQARIAQTQAAIAAAARGEAEVQAEIARTQAAIATAAQGEAEVQAQFAQTQAAIAAAAQGEAERQRNLAQAQATAVARERDRAQSLALAGQSQAERSGPRPERAVLLALEALRNYVYTTQIERALVQAVQSQLAQRTLNQHNGAVYSAAWSPDGTRLVTASADNTARVWNAGGDPLLILRHRGPVNRALWSPDGTRIVTASSDDTAIIWDAASGTPLFTLSGHQEDVLLAVWSPDGRRIATASSDDTAVIWDASSGLQIAVLRGHTGDVNSVDWSPDGERLVTASSDLTARIWDADTGSLLRILVGHDRMVHRAVWSPDGRRIATASSDRTARIWNADTGYSAFYLAAHIGSVTRVAWSPDSRRVVTASADDTARIWNADTGELLYTLFGHTDDVVGTAWSPDGKRIVTTSRDNTARLWDINTGALMLNLTGHADIVYSADWSPSGESVATVSQDGSVRLWQTWTNVRNLIAFAEGCCEARPLTDEERQLFGLPRLPSGAPPADGIVSCPNTLESRLYPGTRGEVTADDEAALNVRSGAGLSEPIIGQIAPRQTFRVLAGPECVDGFAWFRVIFGINAVQGWVAEGGDGKYFTRPVG